MRCLDCDVEMRPRRSGERDFPGTVTYYGRGVCLSCFHARTKAGTVDELPAGIKHRSTQAEIQDAMDDPRRDERNREGLVAFIRARRGRGWPVDGSLGKVEGL